MKHLSPYACGASEAFDSQAGLDGFPSMPFHAGQFLALKTSASTAQCGFAEVGRVDVYLKLPLKARRIKQSARTDGKRPMQVPAEVVEQHIYRRSYPSDKADGHTNNDDAKHPYGELV